MRRVDIGPDVVIDGTGFALDGLPEYLHLEPLKHLKGITMPHRIATAKRLEGQPRPKRVRYERPEQGSLGFDLWQCRRTDRAESY